MYECKQHPKYKAIYKPRVTTNYPGGCSDCWAMYYSKRDKSFWIPKAGDKVKIDIVKLSAFEVCWQADHISDDPSSKYIKGFIDCMDEYKWLKRIWRIQLDEKDIKRGWIHGTIDRYLPGEDRIDVNTGHEYPSGGFISMYDIPRKTAKKVK